MFSWAGAYLYGRHVFTMYEPWVQPPPWYVARKWGGRWWRVTCLLAFYFDILNTNKIALFESKNVLTFEITTHWTAGHLKFNFPDLKNKKRKKKLYVCQKSIKGKRNNSLYLKMVLIAWCFSSWALKINLLTQWVIDLNWKSYKGNLVQIFQCQK